jgi:hypothetical protein
MPEREQKVDKQGASIVATMNLVVPRWENLITKEETQNQFKN